MSSRSPEDPNHDINFEKARKQLAASQAKREKGDAAAKASAEPDYAKSKSRKFNFSRPTKLKAVGAAALALALVGGTLNATSRSNNQSDRIEASTQKESRAVQQQKDQGATCLGGIVLLRSGVEYRDTPETINKITVVGVDKIRITKPGNLAGTVGDGEELPVRQPLVSIDEGGDVWTGFRLKNTGDKKDSTDKSSEEIAKKIYWVKYGEPRTGPLNEALGATKVIDEKNDDNQTMIKTLDLAGNPQAELLPEPCPITNRGLATVNGAPAAYGITNRDGELYPSGTSKQSLQFYSPAN